VGERGGPIGAGAGDLCEGEVAGGAPGVVPGGLGEGVLGGGEQRGTVGGRGSEGLLLEAATELVERFAVGGIRVAEGLARDAGAEVALGVGELAAAQVPAAECEVAAGVAGIAAKRLAPVELGVARGVAVLFEVEAGEVEFVGGRDVGWRGWLGGGLAGELFGGGRLGNDGRVASERATVGGEDFECERGGFRPARERYGFHEWLGGREVAGEGGELGFSAAEDDVGARLGRGDGDADLRGGGGGAEAQRGLGVGVLGGADAADRVPVLAPVLVSPGWRKEKSGWLSV
jgi:hypothetical protein